MRVLLIECYTLVFKITRAKVLSYWISLIYLSMLLFYTLSGIIILTSDWIGFAAQLQIAFLFPFYFVTAPLILAVIYKFTPSVQQVAKDAKRRGSILTILLFSLFVLILFLYMKYGDSFFS